MNSQEHRGLELISFGFLKCTENQSSFQLEINVRSCGDAGAFESSSNSVSRRSSTFFLLNSSSASRFSNLFRKGVDPPESTPPGRAPGPFSGHSPVDEHFRAIHRN